MKFSLLVFLCFSIIQSSKLNPPPKISSESIQETNLYLRVSDKRDILNNPSEFLTHTVMINSNLIYYFEKDENSKKIAGSISLRSLITPNDDPASGKCCVTISSIQTPETPSSNIGFLCFAIDGREEKWQLCSKDSQQLNEFRSSLIQKLIGMTLKTNHTTPRILINFDNSNKCLAPSKSDWDYTYQSSWDCYCTIGDYQSPVNLIKSPEMRISPGILTFKYTNGMNPLARPRNQREVEIIGSFGTMIYQIPERQRQSFESYKISFKFPSEHRINGETFPLEIVIFHHSKDSLEEAALSVLIKEDTQGESELNKFIEDIDFQTWSFDEEVPIKSRPDLRFLISSEEGESRKGFFSYMGSSSSPPCNENVERFIMKKPIKVPMAQITGLRKKAVKGNNARTVREDKNKKVMIYYSQGRKVLEKDREIAKEINGQVKEKMKRVKNRLFPKKYVQVSSNTTDFLITNAKENDLIVGDVNKTIYLNFVKETDIPDYARLDFFRAKA